MSTDFLQLKFKGKEMYKMWRLYFKIFIHNYAAVKIHLNFDIPHQLKFVKYLNSLRL